MTYIQRMFFIIFAMALINAAIYVHIGLDAMSACLIIEAIVIICMAVDFV